MKILVIQLLRLGDVISNFPILSGIQSQYPSAEVDLLINKQFAFMRTILPKHRKLWSLPRTTLQEGLGNPDHSLYFSFDLLHQFLEEVDKERYDLVINLTQNRFSGWVTHLISAEKKLGLHFDEVGQVRFGSDWFAYLNSNESLKEERVHYIDIFKNALNLNNKSLQPQVTETQFGQSEARKVLEGEKPFVLIQPLTSDEKKNWGLHNFEKLIHYLKVFKPLCDIIILGAPNEELELREWIRSSQIEGPRVRLSVCSLDGAYSLLKKSSLLVTGDTSIKHLAVAAQTSILEIDLGSSDYRSTGAYQANSVIVASNESCQPCSHSEDCFRSRHYCSERVHPESISLIAKSLLDDDWQEISRVAQKYSEKMSVFKTCFSEAGFWKVDLLSQKGSHYESGVRESSSASVRST